MKGMVQSVESQSKRYWISSKAIMPIVRSEQRPDKRFSIFACVVAEQCSEPERRIGRILKSEVLGRRRVTGRGHKRGSFPFCDSPIRDNQPPQACGMSQCEEVPSDEQEKQTAQLTRWARPKFAVCSRMKKSQRPFMVMLSWEQFGRKMREDTQGRRSAACRGGWLVSFWTPLLR
jgi:hypothetical protein